MDEHNIDGADLTVPDIQVSQLGPYLQISTEHTIEQLSRLIWSYGRFLFHFYNDTLLVMEKLLGIARCFPFAFHGICIRLSP